jgi:hypothetical protein
MDSGLARSLSSGAQSRDPLARPGMTNESSLSLTIEPIPLPPRPREPMAATEGDFMKKWFGAAAVLLAACLAFAANVAKCTVGADDGEK